MNEEESNNGQDETRQERPQVPSDVFDTGQGEAHKTIPLSGMYKSWFLDYASYVILERAVPDIKDGLKPVQRRILHAMKDLDDGRYNKVANIIGHTMKYHPHGDASIGDALVQLGQKELLIDTQGNWGNILTGDSAAAPRYIEARLSKFSAEVVFNPKTTVWKSSYDGRNREPVTLPVKFPLLLAMGVEGIAVGLASKIMPHNFNELIDASIEILQGNDFVIYPDFITGGMADFSKYNEGMRGGRIRIRSKISQIDKKTLAITEIPFGTNTGALIDSIIAASDKGKIKIKKVDDNTAENVEIIIQLPPGVSPDQTIDALFAFTQCEISVSPNSCVISDGRPEFLSVKEMLRISTQNTLGLLKQELEIRLSELYEEWHFASLEKIFIEKRIYRKIENCETWESVIETIDKGLEPYKKIFKREITRDDIIRLTEIKIKRISRYNAFKADETIARIEGETDEVKNHLEHLVDYAINYFRQIRKKYGPGRERKTEIRNFDTIEATMVAAATQKLYVNREEGFAGTSLRKDEYVCDCSDIDDIICFRDDGTFVVTKVSAKTFVGRDIIHIDVFRKTDDRTIYNVIYRDGLKGPVRVKRFPVTSIMRDKEYDVTRGSKGSKILYFTSNPNGEAEVVKVNLKPKPKLKKLSFDFDFSELTIKGRSAAGNLLTKHGIRNILKREEGVSTLGARNIWYDETVQRLNAEERGVYLGAFKADDRILTIQKSGNFRLMNYDLSNHFEEDMVYIARFDPARIITAIYFDAPVGKIYVKRFEIEDDTPLNKKIDFIGENGNHLIAFSVDRYPQMLVKFVHHPGKKPAEDEVIALEEFIGVKSYKAKGKRVAEKDIEKVYFIDPLPGEDENPEQPAGTAEETDPDFDGMTEERTFGNTEEAMSGKQDPDEDNVPEEEKKEKKGGTASQMELEF
ncbi:MAG: DNA gyrase/topoisomerase IV subunit A [Bacteroidales bacterium]|nr:DNA gyrase/topoisomerase IV subunit A [Bacteroidales bacterium]